MKQIILAKLESLEEENNVKVLIACESGSRAWGFPSSDSDFDVRFIYLHPPDWYLSVNLEQKRDVIERPINENLDVSGWDLRKALKLYYKSNPPLLEWLGSPIIYYEKYSTAQRMRELAPTFYNPLACMYHYLHMAQGNYRAYLKGEQVWVKKYFYVLRPLLAVNWLENGMGVVPTEFEVLVNKVIQSKTLQKSIVDLIVSKRQGQELDYGPRIPAISDFIDNEMERLEGKKFDANSEKRSFDKLNHMFQSSLKEVWKG